MKEGQSKTNGLAKPPACTLVIFGAGGDLTKRLLAPALYNLAGDGLLPDDFKVIGVDRGGSLKEWRWTLIQAMRTFTEDSSAEFYIPRIEEDQWRRVEDCLQYVEGDFNDEGVFRKLSDALGKDCAIFYLAVSPQLFSVIVDGLGEERLLDQSDGKFRRLVIEKPFGSDHPSARALTARLARSADESQIYRIDHFLGKEAVQDILAVRFANGMFEPALHRDLVDHVQITVTETVGVEKRGSFYETTGALRDMVPSHLLSLLCAVAMEPPDSFDAEVVRDARVKLIQSVVPIRPEHAVRGQYRAGNNETDAKSYREEPDVAVDSSTETYVALKLFINNKRWAGVPFYLRTGKHLSDRVSMVSIHYKSATNSAFCKIPVNEHTPNVLRFLIDPDQGLETQFSAKMPGPKMKLGRVQTSVCLKDFFDETPSVGYENSLYACMIGDPTLFHRADAIDASWLVVQPLLEAWSHGGGEIAGYPAGSSGPSISDALLRTDERKWLPLC